MPKRAGRPSVAQTPAPKSDKIYGSKKNPKGSATEKKSKSIKLSDKTIDTLKEKLDNFKKSHPSKKNIDLNDLKAVYRRGSGAYSSSHRPTITGGAPNSRAAWSYARVNKFLKKAGGAKVKAAYVQDDDLMADGGVVELLGEIQVYPNGAANVTLWNEDEKNVGYVEIQYDKVENLLYAPYKLEGISKKDYVSDTQYKILTNELKNYGINPSDKIHYIEQIEIYEEFRGKGYASQALTDAIDFYKSEGVDFLLLTVGADTSEKGALSNKKLIDFYKRHGFKLLKGTGNYKNRMILDLNELAKGGKVFNDKELLAKWKKGESIGFTGESHLKAKGLIPRADGSKRKSDKYMAKGGVAKGGDCYAAAGQFCMGSVYMKEPVEFVGEPYLVHAEVRGQGKIEGLRFGHAWVEDDENVYDYSNARKIVMPKVVYYAIGDVKKENPLKYQKYTFPEARAKMLKTKHYGSWDIETEYKDGGLIDLIEEVKLDKNIYEQNIEHHSVYSKINSDIDAEKILKENFIQSFEKNVQIENDDVCAYRLLMLDDISDLDTNNLGIYWAYSENKVVIADDEGYEHKKSSYKNQYVIKVKANIKNINWQDTFDLYVMNDWMEGEIRFIKNTKPSETYYKKLGDSEWIKLDKNVTFAKGGQFNRESGLKKLAKEKKATITNAFDQLKKSMLADQYKIVRTSEFKNWFGDWQKDPNNCSVIREKNGEPMVVWHGSPSKFNIFKNVENGVFYFAENGGYASHFADGTKNTYPYYLNIRKIFDALKFDIKENEANFFIKEFGINTKWLKSQDKLNKRIKFWELLRHDEDFRKYLIKQGYDGIRYVEDNDDGWIEKSVAYGCFNANQIKLANGVNTTFSTKSKDIRYADGGMIAPNGNPSNLTPEQYELVRTPEFKEWFGDWENNPENASKIVDENGEPMVVYHGTKNEFSIFDLDKVGTKTDTGMWGKGFYFSSNKKYSETYASSTGYVFDFFLSIKNPYIIKSQIDIPEIITPSETMEDLINAEKIYSEKFRETLIDKGNDGVFVNFERIDNYIEFVAFEPNQIKLADGTNTTFDMNNPDIRFSEGGQPSQLVTCINCSWEWETADSAEFDKYVCHQCGFDNSLFYDGGILKPTMPLDQIAEKHKVSFEYLEEQLDKGIQQEKDHTDSDEVAKKIALHHLAERPDYYEELEKMEKYDENDILENNSPEEYEIEAFLKKEKEEAHMVMTCDSSRIYKAMICKTKCEIADKRMAETENTEELNAWLHYRTTWNDCLQDILDDNIEMYKVGGKTCGCGCGSIYSKGGLAFANGGLAYGNSHDKGGMPLTVKSTGQNIEIEGGEGVVNKRSMQSSKKVEFEGKQMTPCEAVSKINEMGGGVKFKCDDVKNIIAEDGQF